MQALVRARRARMSLEGLIIKEKFNEKDGQDVKPPVRGIPGTTVKSNFSSTEKLLGNGFARQLLESMPKKKPIRVKCDPLRPDSAWKWLERWVSVSSSDFTQPPKPQSTSNNDEHVERADGSTSELETEGGVLSGSADLKSNVRETETSLIAEENLIAYDANNFQFQSCPPTIMRNDIEQPSSADFGLSEAQENSLTIDTNQINLRPDGACNKMLDSISSKPEADSEPPKHSAKRAASEQPDTEGKKIVVGSKKSRNPAFAAAQSKFEELSSTPTAGRSVASTHHDTEVESTLAHLSPSADYGSPTKTEELISVDDSVSDQRTHSMGLERGTELISSTLSPEISEVVSGQHENVSTASTEVISDLSVTRDYEFYHGDLDDEAEEEEESPSLPANLSNSVSVQPGKLGYANREATDSIYANGEVVDSVYANGGSVASVYPNDDGKAVDSVYANGETIDSPLATKMDEVKQQPDGSASNEQIQFNNTEDRQAYRTPDESPRSHITAPESHGTPSSQLSVDAKKKKLNKKEANQRKKSQSDSKMTPSNPNHDSGGRNSSEQMAKDSKNGKRRNSSGLTKLDYGDQELRESSSSNSLPSYMQATQSAKAKLHASNSPRSSPDMQDNEHYIKKRHSLPNGNGKQVSPRVQSSTPPQAQQGAKEHRGRWQR